MPPGVAALSAAVAGQDVLLVGSAPGACLAGAEADLVAMVNGAALGLPVRVVPDILFVNTALAACTRAGRPTSERLAELATDLLVVVVSATPLDAATPVFEKIGRRCCAALPLAERTRFLEEFLGRALAAPWGGAHVPSIGFLSGLLLLAAGARRVQMRGFGVADGHSYLPEVFRRGHVEHDQEILQLVRERKLPVDWRPAPDGLPPA